ncbi:hypothetical protein FGW37_10690 [Streptomyces rectiverticillatus]|uniref:hypothetical protein n=1 Tax=Streptomyces rectiverticillatus TaxID=173860 RepID=UPI0015C3D899|nr:hypothetical protein [Streptomyces rectiverticillatus]QLE72009.1 hypothetical protein FGW37_10690 [Streptomyces rectiverticillatus]
MVTVSASRPWTYTLELPRDPSAQAVARAVLRAVLSERGMAELTGAAETLTAELIATAPAPAGAPLRLRLRGGEGGGRLQVSVGGHITEVAEEHGRTAVPLAGCRECAALDAARREAEVHGGDKAVDAAIAVRRHFRMTHRLPEGATG